MCIVSGKIEGNLTGEVAIEYFTRMGEVITQKGCEKVLTDVRNADFKASDKEMLELSKMISEMGVTASLRRAIVLSDDVKKYKVWENCCFRQGHQQIKLFYDQLKALDWLSSN